MSLILQDIVLHLWRADSGVRGCLEKNETVMRLDAVHLLKELAHDLVGGVPALQYVAELGRLAARLVISQPFTRPDRSPDRDGASLVLAGEVVFPNAFPRFLECLQDSRSGCNASPSFL